jgi:hypothetical protein
MKRLATLSLRCNEVVNLPMGNVDSFVGEGCPCGEKG